jgi:hypothetical protein
MSIYTIISLLGLLIFVLLLVTQIVIPVLWGYPLFPLFRRRRKLERLLADEQEYLTEDKLAKNLDELRLARLAREKQSAARTTVNQQTQIEKKG